MVLKKWLGLFKANNVVQSLRPLTYISWLSLAPFWPTVNADNKVRNSKFAILIGIFYYMLYVIGLTTFDIFKKVTEKWTGALAMTTFIGIAIFNRQKLAGVIQNIIAVDEIFVRLGKKINYQRILLFSFYTFMALFILNAIYLGAFFRLYESKRYFCGSLTFLVIPHINICIMIFAFICMTRLAQSRFVMINEILQDIADDHSEQKTVMELSTINSTVNVTSNKLQNAENIIKEVTNIHYLLCDICETIEEYFNYPLLVTISISFLVIVFKGNFLMLALLNPYSLSLQDEAYEKLLVYGVEVVWYSVITLIIVKASTNTIGHSSFTATIVCKILNITDDPKLKDRLSRLSSQLTHRKVSFTAAGWFSLDRTIIFTMVSTAATYLIILMQSNSIEFERKSPQEILDEEFNIIKSLVG